MRYSLNQWPIYDGISLKNTQVQELRVDIGGFGGFSSSLTGKESTCNAGDPSSIPGSRRSFGEGIGYRLQYFWTFLVAQMVKNLPAMWETWIQSLGWEDPLEKGMATHSNILAWRIPMDRGAWQATLYGVAKSRRRLSN